MAANDQLTLVARKEERKLLKGTSFPEEIAFKKAGALFAGFGFLKGCLSFMPPMLIKQTKTIKLPVKSKFKLSCDQ